MRWRDNVMNVRMSKRPPHIAMMYQYIIQHGDGCQGSVYWDRLPYLDERGVLMEYNPLECMSCGRRDCPNGEPFHYHHDGCPDCEY
jgi:hypothetical protein